MPITPATPEEEEDDRGKHEVLMAASKWAHEVLSRKDRLDGERHLLLRLLRRRFGAEIDGEIEQRLAAASGEQLELWADRILSAGSLADLLAS